ncbi:CheR family methyltransferase [Falsihalocynthiibacter sp. SS001]|uniref:CheR family methyltransferase n=1 Tax=Falsihalocynthiibacter sp. SS001 TaxID=3349698 RepID=UPI0036D2E126
MTLAHQGDSAIDGGITASQFELIAAIAHSEAGLVFQKSKSALVASRLSKRLRLLKIESFGDYCDLVSSHEGSEEIQQMISALTTNISSFFRERHHFDAVKNHVLPSIEKNATQNSKIRIWSAGCSMGMEAYSIAITIMETWPQAQDLDIKILATDIDRSVLETGIAGIFDHGQVSTVPEGLREKYFHRQHDPKLYQVCESLRRMITFRELNLLKPWPISTKFDVIFCRNTVIYFDDATQRKLWPRFQNVLLPEGWLFVGHSERIPENSGTDFKSLGMTMYQRRNDISKQ